MRLFPAGLSSEEVARRCASMEQYLAQWYQVCLGLKKRFKDSLSDQEIFDQAHYLMRNGL